MDSKTMKFIAAELVSSIRAHVTERLGPLQSKQDALVSVVNDLREKVDALEARLADAEAKSAGIRRVA